MSNIQKTVSLVVGIVFIVVGVLGFVPILVSSGGDLLGIFAINALHNVVHLLIGILGVAAASMGWPRLYNRIMGIVYLALAVLGFIPGLVMNGALLGLVSINLADNLLHLVVGAALTYIGFFLSERAAPARA